MKNILYKNDLADTIIRVNSLTPTTISLWGKMNINQMICHCSDQILMAMGTIDIQFVGSFFSSTVLKNLILLGMPAPKGKIETYKELNQEFGGTKPTTFEDDRAFLIKTAFGFSSSYPRNSQIIHPTFGSLNKNNWGRLIYIHLNHHLKQFGN